MNVATLHYYFPTKEALIRAVVAHAMSRFGTTLAGEGSPRDQLRAHIRGLRSLLDSEPELMAVMGELALRSARDPAIAEMLRVGDQAWSGWLTRLLGGPDPAAKAALIMATMRGLFMLPGISSDPERVERTFGALERALDA